MATSSVYVLMLQLLMLLSSPLVIAVDAAILTDASQLDSLTCLLTHLLILLKTKVT